MTTSIRTIEVDRWAWTRFIRDSGWMMLSSAFLVVAGVTRIVAPAWVVPYRIDYPKSQTALPGDALRTYGWIWLIVGLLLLTSEMLTSKTGDSCRAELSRCSRIIGTVIGAISAILLIPFGAIWTLAYVTVALLAINRLIRELLVQR